MVICLEQVADLHMAQLMQLPLTISCFSKIQIGFTFLVPAHPGSPRKRAVKWVCVCVCVCARVRACVRVTSNISNKCIAVRKVATLLRKLTCHMGSHSVTCHPAEVTFPPLPSRSWYSIKRPRRDARLSRPSVCVLQPVVMCMFYRS